MNVLFFIEPWIDAARPKTQGFWIEFDILPLLKTVSSFEERPNVFCLVGDAQEKIAKKKLPGCPLGIIRQKDLGQIFPNTLTAALAWYHETASPQQMQKMKALVKAALNGFVPDIIVGVFTSMPFLRELFPEALLLHIDSGYFSRFPFSRTLTLDPCGMLKNGFLGRHTGNILSQPLSKSGRLFLNRFRRHYIDETFVAKSFFSREKLTGGKPFDHLLLLPLNVSRQFASNGNAPFEDQWEMLCYVLDHTPENIGVVVTQHTSFEKVIKPELHRYLKRTYPHYIFLKSFNRYRMISQYLLAHVDAVAAVSSSLCYQALLWEKPVCALGKCQINLFADTENLAELGDVLKRKDRPSKDPLLHYILTRLNIPACETYLYNPSWLEGRLPLWLDRFRKNGVQKDFFDPIAEEERLLEHYLQGRSVK